MRWFITFLLLILVVGGGAFLFFADPLLRTTGLKPPPVPPSESVAALAALSPEQVRKLELSRDGQPPLTLIRDGGRWTQPGEWPVREKEVAELVQAVAGLRTRYRPTPIGEDAAAFGLAAADKPYTVVLQTGDNSVSLKFGQGKDGGAYVRVGDRPEVMRIGPDVLQAVARNPEEYRRRQLFPDAPRVRLSGDGPAATAVPVIADRVQEVRVTSPDGSYALKRLAPNPAARRDPDRPAAPAAVAVNELADAWQWVAPDGKTSDRVDPAKLRAIVSTVPDLWVDGFPQTTKDGQPLTDATTGLDKPERTLTLIADGKPVSLKIGGVSRTVTRKEPAPPPPPGNPFPMPPGEREVVDTYHYAKFENNPLVFEVKADKFADLFAKPDDLRDATLARFTAEETQSVEIAIPAKSVTEPAAVIGTAALTMTKSEATTVKLTRKKGNPNAIREDDKQDRWYVGDRLAEAGKVTELLDALSKLDAKAPADRLDEPKPEALAAFTKTDGFRVTVVAQAKVIEGDTPPPARTYTFQISGRNPETKKLAVSMAGRPRVNFVDDAVFTLAERSSLAYRSRRLFDTAEATLEAVTAAKQDGAVFELKSARKAGGDTAWMLTKPLSIETDSAKASKLTGDLSNLEAAEYVDDAPAAAKVSGEYGLSQPRYTLDLGFTGTGAKPQKMEIGAVRSGKPEAYARLNGGGVFTVPQTIVDTLDKGAIDLLPLQLWTSLPNKVTSVGVERGEEKYTLTKDGEKWKLSGPFDAAAGTADATALATGLASLKADKYDALTPDPAKHGLDKPTVTVRVTLLEKQPNADVEQPVTRTIQIGKPTGELGTPGRFAKLADGPNQAVFVIPDATVTAADKPALGWLDRTLLTLDPTKLTKVQVTSADTVTLTKENTTADWKTDGFALDKQVVGNLVFAAASPPVVRFAGYGPSVKWADFGLDKPAYTITVTTGGEKPETHTLKLGKEEPSGERYVRVDDGLAVGVVSGATSAALARGKLQLADRGLLTFDPTQLTGITRKSGKDEFELSQGLGWDVVKPTKFKADVPTVEDLADQLARLRAEKVSDLDPKDLKAFGLDAPAAEVMLAVGIEKPKTLTLQVGKPVEDGKPTGDRFVRVDKTGPVKVLAGAVANKLLAEPIKFKDKALAKFVDADKVTITRGDRKATFAKVAGTWKMTEPTARDAEQADLDELVNLAAKLRADELAAEKPTDLKPFGLDTPQAKVQFFSADKEVLSVLVGKLDGATKRAFGKLEKSDAVALFDPAVTDRLLGEYRKRAVWSGVDAAQVQTLAVSAGTTNFVFRKAGPLWMDPTKPDEIPDTAKITDTLAALAGLKAERFVADKDADLKLYGLEKPSRVIVAGQPNGESKTLHLGGEVGGTNGKQVYAKVAEPDRTDVFVLSEADTAKLVRDRAGYAAKK